MVWLARPSSTNAAGARQLGATRRCVTPHVHAVVDDKMALFDRIKAAVKGNAVLKEYEVGQQIASAGPGLLWRVCRGVKRTSRKVWFNSLQERTILVSRAGMARACGTIVPHV